MQPVTSILEGLNPEQQRAVQHVEGPLLVLAGAGSGKTRMLTHRIAHLIATGAAQRDEILAVTFTNKAAKEMRERVNQLSGYDGYRIWVATFHSTCVRILRSDIGQLGYERGFVIYDQTDSLALVKRVLRQMNLDERSHPPRGVRAELDRVKSRGLMPADVIADGTLHDERLGEIYRQYQTELRRANALDFGDLIVLTVRLFQNHPGVLESYQRRWRYILVDEYQDTNPVQYQLLRLLAAQHRNLCVVGDEDQSIYRFREADIRNILDFEKDYPGAAVVRLERNYRSTQQILDAATAVVSNNTERKGKKLVANQSGGDPIRFFEAADDRAEASYVIRELLRLRDRGQPLSESAIFYRTHAQSRPFEEELRNYDVDYTMVGGTRFYDRAEIKDALAYLRILRNPNDTESLRRIINSPVRGIGKTTVERLLMIGEQHELSLYRASELAIERGMLRGAAAKRVPEFFAMMDALRDDAPASVAQCLAQVLDRSGTLRALEREGSIEAEGRQANLQELLVAAEEFERDNESLDEDHGEERNLLDLFLESITLYSELDDYDETRDRIALMTVHVAKGLEFQTVFLVGVEEGLFPHFASLNDPAAIEEERRLCYVGMTRAKSGLHITNASMRRMHGSVRYNAPSRFLAEIPEEFGVGREQRRNYARGPGFGTARPRLAPTSTPGAAGEPTIDYSEAQYAPDDGPSSGSRVEHPVFGAGTIMQVVGSGQNTKLRIRFDRAGLKTIVLRYAQLRLLA